MNYNEYLSKQKIFNVLDGHTNLDYIDAIQILLEKKDYDMIKYCHLDEIHIQHIDALRTNNQGRYYYEINLARDCDIISDFQFVSSDTDIDFSIILNDSFEYKEVKELILVASPYTSAKLRITFRELPKYNDKIRIHYYKYLCNSDTRNYLMRTKIITSSFVYNEGVILYNTI